MDDIEFLIKDEELVQSLREQAEEAQKTAEKALETERTLRQNAEQALTDLKVKVKSFIEGLGGHLATVLRLVPSMRKQAKDLASQVGVDQKGPEDVS